MSLHAACVHVQPGHEIAAELCLSGGTDVELGSTLTSYTAGAVAAGVSSAGLTTTRTLLLHLTVVVPLTLSLAPTLTLTLALSLALA